MIFLEITICLVCILLTVYCVVYVSDITGVSKPKEKLRYSTHRYVVIMYRRRVTYELVVKSRVECSILYCNPAIPFWRPSHALFLVGALGILNTPELMELSSIFEETKFSVF